jgi:RNA polymerase sigma-70 factor (ECF subfamily)
MLGTGGMLRSQSHEITELLMEWRTTGDQDALEALVPLVYKELHALAHYCLQGERSQHTLQTTALVHEAYLRLVDQSPVPSENRAHFVAIAARLMRQILVDYARSRRAAKRGADCTVQLDTAVDPSLKQPADVVALDDALNQLSRLDPQQGRIVELRYFGGLTVKETAGVLGISAATVKRDWNLAKAWLAREIKRGGRATSGAVGKN